jgi:GT2 family glycosyltransferase
VSAARELRPTCALILAMNQLPMTRQCLTSVLAMDPAPDWILLVDNGSTDGTAGMVRREFPGVEVLRLDRNLYFAGGVNEGLRSALARGARSVLLLNNDVVLERAALGKLRAAMERDPGLAAISPKIFYYDVPDVIWFAGGEVGRYTGLIRHRGVNVKDEKLRDAPRDVDYVSFAAALLSREGIESAGLLDPDYVMYVEDVDWGARARDKGFRLGYEPSAKVWHHVSATSGGGLTPLKAYFRLRSGALYLRRHGTAMQRSLASIAYLAWTKWLIARSLLGGDARSAGALLLGFLDFTLILSGFRPPVRTPESFAPPSPRR